MEAIARRAGVARATVYRRWPNRDALLAHLLWSLVRDVPVPLRRNVRDELIELLGNELRFLEIEAGRLYPSLGVHARVDTAAGEALDELVQRRKAAVLAVLERGIERGQIRSDFDTDLGYFALWGPAYYRFLGAVAGKEPIEGDFVVKLVDSVLNGISARTS